MLPFMPHPMVPAASSICQWKARTPPSALGVCLWQPLVRLWMSRVSPKRQDPNPGKWVMTCFSRNASELPGRREQWAVRVRDRLMGCRSLCSRFHSIFLYFVNRLYRTRSVDLRSRLTTSSGRALGFASPPSSMSSKARATL